MTPDESHAIRVAINERDGFPSKVERELIWRAWLEHQEEFKKQWQTKYK